MSAKLLILATICMRQSAIYVCTLLPVSTLIFYRLCAITCLKVVGDLDKFRNSFPSSKKCPCKCFHYPFIVLNVYLQINIVSNTVGFCFVAFCSIVATVEFLRITKATHKNQNYHPKHHR